MLITEKINAMIYDDKILYLAFFCQKYVNETFSKIFKYIDENRKENDNDDELPIKFDFDTKNQYVKFYVKYYNNQDFDFFKEFFAYFFKVRSFAIAKSNCTRGIQKEKRKIMSTEVNEYLDIIYSEMIKLCND